MRMPDTIAAEFFSDVTARSPDARDFEHPFYWAAFYLTGV
jgi:CHAT domain-containing protein